ncbi:aspartyl-phosphate phosphatase Spo0E family protein [Wukongibacter baidiensis]|uniref:Spo0E family sporulation regulatory protein-aspartic acid phosphatase n=1 Tax=Wukongibacter baidiensis TaxID=1723361 RepID=UPI003D7FD527
MQNNSLSQQDINKKILELRLKLNKAYAKQGHTDDVIKLSQELDKYIVLIQEQLLKNTKSPESI